jgi:hypothetical protein
MNSQFFPSIFAHMTPDSSALFPFRLARQILQQVPDTELHRFHCHINWNTLMTMIDLQDRPLEKDEVLRFCEACFMRHALREPLLAHFVQQAGFDRIIHSLDHADFHSQSCAVQALAAAVNTGTPDLVIDLLEKGVLDWSLRMLKSCEVGLKDPMCSYLSAIKRMRQEAYDNAKHDLFNDLFVKADGATVFDRLQNAIHGHIDWAPDLKESLDAFFALCEQT